mmetsp:Transcript_13261/g.30101  ORF Transcript_13261/g.30101 Transcript_13261/m.30101 type:complete len:257 (+) Transcript_13261:2086-2856(+)
MVTRRSVAGVAAVNSWTLASHRVLTTLAAPRVLLTGMLRRPRRCCSTSPGSGPSPRVRRRCCHRYRRHPGRRWSGLGHQTQYRSEAAAARHRSVQVVRRLRQVRLVLGRNRAVRPCPSSSTTAGSWHGPWTWQGEALVRACGACHLALQASRPRELRSTQQRRRGLLRLVGAMPRRTLRTKDGRPCSRKLRLLKAVATMTLGCRWFRESTPCRLIDGSLLQTQEGPSTIGPGSWAARWCHVEAGKRTVGMTPWRGR